MFALAAAFAHCTDSFRLSSIRTPRSFSCLQTMSSKISIYHVFAFTPVLFIKLWSGTRLVGTGPMTSSLVQPSFKLAVYSRSVSFVSLISHKLSQYCGLCVFSHFTRYKRKNISQSVSQKWERIKEHYFLYIHACK